MIQRLESLVRKVAAPSARSDHAGGVRRVAITSIPIGVTVSVIAAALFAIGVGSSSAATPTISAISVGQYHTCALTSAGGVKCWGDNTYGQLGDGTTTMHATPVDVSGLTSGVIAVSAGEYHTCALMSSGGVKCWGYNALGALGDGTTTSRPTPVDVSGLTSGVIAISAGYFHTCALMSSGGVKCWGYNVYGQLGDGTTTMRSAPVDVSGLTSGVSAIGAGQYHTCAVTTAGAVECWGYNGLGGLGDGTTTTRLTPVGVSGLASGAVAVSAGAYHSCALTSAGGVKCWGYNASGQLGDGTTTMRLTPVDVSGLTSGVTEMSAGQYHTCARTAAGGAKCWGYNGFGGLGDGTTTMRSTPVDVSGLTSGVTAVVAGGYHSCAVTSGGGAKCWGYNNAGQIGDGTTTTRMTAQVVFADPVVTSPTKMTVSAASGEFAHSASVSATLTNADTSAPVAGKQVTFVLDGTETCTAMTDVNGNAKCSMTPHEAANTYPLNASFAGDANFTPSSGSADFVVGAAPATVMYTGTKLSAGDGPATMSGVLTDDRNAPITGRTLMLTLGSGATAQSCSGTTDATGAASCAIASVTQPVGPGSVTVAFAGDGFYQPAANSATMLVFDPDGRGMFVIGDKSATGSVTFSGAQWAKANSLSGGSAPSAFKGFENSTATPTCGSSWTTSPGDSAGAPEMGSTYMPVIVASSITKSGSMLSGNTVHVVIVKTDATHPADAATGTVVGQIC
jgi:alpha-tubulin suppressor-like RCC1 family protein